MLPQGVMITSRTELLPGPMSGSIAMKQQRSVLMPMASLTTESCADRRPESGQIPEHTVAEGEEV